MCVVCRRLRGAGGGGGVVGRAGGRPPRALRAARGLLQRLRLHPPRQALLAQAARRPQLQDLRR